MTDVLFCCIETVIYAAEIYDPVFTVSNNVRDAVTDLTTTLTVDTSYFSERSALCTIDQKILDIEANKVDNFWRYPRKLIDNRPLPTPITADPHYIDWAGNIPFNLVVNDRPDPTRIARVIGIVKGINDSARY